MVLSVGMALVGEVKGGVALLVSVVVNREHNLLDDCGCVHPVRKFANGPLPGLSVTASCWTFQLHISRTQGLGLTKAADVEYVMISAIRCSDGHG